MYEKLRFIKNNLFFPILITLLWAVIFAANYTPGTYLIGWDNVMPEFDLKLNFDRAFFSVWQDYRGLGVIDGLSHAANLTHTLYISLLSMFIPQNLLRYTFIYSTYLVGGLASYFLLIHLTRNKTVSFIGGLFYMLNLGIIQIYYAPLEAFAVQFAALPLMTFAIIKFFNNSKLKTISVVALLSFLTSPQGFVPTLFIVYCILLSSLSLFYFLQKRKIKAVLILWGVIFLTNAFWILPFSYQALINAQNIKNTRINQFSSDEIYLRSKARGNMLDVLTTKGFMIDTVEYNVEKNGNEFFMEEWRKYTSSLPYKVISGVFIFIAGTGLFSILKNKKKEGYAFGLTFIISFFFLANNTPIFSGLNDLIRLVFPIFGEVFRFPFTKFITLFAFSFTILFAFGILKIKTLLPKYKEVDILVLLVFFGIIIFSAFPVFSGYFTSPTLRRTVPQEYFDAFSYFLSQNKDARIALLPLPTYWNWQYTDWGHKGSGFLWYGLEQPILLRAFDPWSDKNAQVYNELSYAINTEDINYFTTALKKYDIKHLLIDRSIINTLSPKPIDYDSLTRFLGESTELEKTKDFGKIVVYKVKDPAGSVYTLPIENTAVSSSTFTLGYKDWTSILLGNYVTSDENPNVYSILPSLSTQKLQEDLGFTVSETNEDILLSPKKDLPKDLTGYNLVIPSITREFLIPVEIQILDGQLSIAPIYPKVLVDGKDITPAPFNKTLSISFQPDKISDQFLGEDKEIKDNKVKTYLLKDASNLITISNGSESENIEFDAKELDLEPLIIPLPPRVDSISIKIPKIKSQINEGLDKINWEFPQDKNVFNPFLSKKKIGHEFKGNKLILTAKSGISEAAFYKDDIMLQNPYIMLVNATTITGLPINFYVDSPKERRSIVDTRLSNNGLNAVTIPVGSKYFQGYGFHFLLKSIGTEIAQGEISDVELYPLPQETLENIRLFRVDDPVLSSQNPVKRPADWQKIHSYKYIIQSPINSYITISEAYDPGWKAYVFEKEPSFIQKIFPFLFGSELKNHVIVNNWANGWRIEPEVKTSSPEATVTIVFLPQYLQFAGFFALGGLLIALIVIGVKSLLFPPLRTRRIPLN